MGFLWLTACVMVQCGVYWVGEASLTPLPFLGVSSQ